jgi:hypothetical protein
LIQDFLRLVGGFFSPVFLLTNTANMLGWHLIKRAMPEVSATRLEEFELSPEAYLDDFADEEEHLIVEYHEFLDAFAKPGATPAALPRAKEITKRSNPREYRRLMGNAQRWQKHGHPRGVNALVELNALDVFEGEKGYKFDGSELFDPRKLKPITVESKYFELLSFLTLFTHWTGTLLQSNCSTGKHAVLTGRDFSADTAFNILSKTLKKMKWAVDLDGDDNRDCLIVGEITRLLPFFGAHVGNKIYREDCFPSIIQSARNTLANSEDSELRELAYNILRDFVVLLFLVRGRTGNDVRDRKYLVSSVDEGIAQVQAEEFLKIMDVVDMPYSFAYGQDNKPTGGPTSSRDAVIFSWDENPFLMQRLRMEMHGRVRSLLGQNILND